MNEETKLLHRLSIDLKRDIKDIKKNMSWYEFNQWAKYYNEIITLETISYQIAQLTELFYKANFEGEVTIYNFLPNSTEKEKEDALLKLKQSKIDEELNKF